ncbi:hypothetical protein V8F33_006879 [Rhypophila sp. PSN 637]
MLLDSPSWPPNPWATLRITNSLGIKLPSLPASPEPETKEKWRQRMARYAPNQGWRFVLDHPTNPPPKSKHRLNIEEQNDQERTFAQEFSERYLSVREKATVYPGEELDDDPMLSQGKSSTRAHDSHKVLVRTLLTQHSLKVVLENEIQLEINEAITHLESLLAIISHVQKSIPVNIFDAEIQDSLELAWTSWRPTGNDADIIVPPLIHTVIHRETIPPRYNPPDFIPHKLDTHNDIHSPVYMALVSSIPNRDATNRHSQALEWRFWVLDWYLNGREQLSITKLITARVPMADSRKRNKEWAWAWGIISNRRLNWGFRVPVLGVDISVRIIRSACTSSQMKEKEKEKGGNSSTELYGGLDLGYYFTDD